MMLDGLLQDGLFYARFWILHFTLMMYWIWIPGFLLSGILAIRGQRRALARVESTVGNGWTAVRRGLWAAFIGTASRRHATRRTIRLWQRGGAPAAVLAHWVGSHALVLYLLSLMELALGIEFALSLLLAGVASATLLGTLGVRLARLPVADPDGGPPLDAHTVARERSWRETLLTGDGWLAIGGYVGRELIALVLPFLWGALMGGFLLAAGLLDAWPAVAEDGGGLSELATALVAPIVAALGAFTPVGAVPVAASLWKTYTVAFAGLLAFQLGTLFHPWSWRDWSRAIGRAATLRLFGVTFACVVGGALLVVAIYALIGFAPGREPVFEAVTTKILEWLP